MAVLSQFRPTETSSKVPKFLNQVKPCSGGSLETPTVLIAWPRRVAAARRGAMSRGTASRSWGIMLALQVDAPMNTAISSTPSVGMRVAPIAGAVRARVTNRQDTAAPVASAIAHARAGKNWVPRVSLVIVDVGCEVIRKDGNLRTFRVIDDNQFAVRCRRDRLQAVGESDALTRRGGEQHWLEGPWTMTPLVLAPTAHSLHAQGPPAEIYEGAD